jgi:hypothetical protein
MPYTCSLLGDFVIVTTLVNACNAVSTQKTNNWFTEYDKYWKMQILRNHTTIITTYHTTTIQNWVHSTEDFLFETNDNKY